MAKNLERQKLIKELDEVFSDYVRKVAKSRYGKCPFCKKARISSCFHFVSRKKYIVRWDTANATGSCYGCNYRMEFDPHDFILWYIDTYGLDAYRLLITTSKGASKISDIELEAMIVEYKLKLKDI